MFRTVLTLSLRAALCSVAVAVAGGPPASADAAANDSTKIIVHRAAAAVALENSIGAIRDAHAWGADGVEIDIRGSADGVLYLFHDDMLDVHTDEVGPPTRLAWRELRHIALRDELGVRRGRGVVTLDEAFTLVRELGLLLHLDVKEPGLEAQIAAALDEHSLWQRVVFINQANAAGLRADRRYRERRYKGPLYHQREDWHEPAIRDLLRAPGGMVIVDDPRATAALLGRDVAPGTTRAPELPPAARPGAAEVRRAVRVLGDGTWPDSDDARRRVIERRAEAAGIMARAGSPSERAVRRLRAAARAPVDHPERTYSGWLYDGADASLALRALSDLNAACAAEIAIALLAQARADERAGGNARPGWWRLRDEALRALGRAQHDDAGAALERYLDDDGPRRNLRLAAEAASFWALRRDDERSRGVMSRLLTDTRLVVRGSAIERCVTEGGAAARALLSEHAPFALSFLATPEAEPAGPAERSR